MSATASMPLLCRLRHRWDDPPWQPSVGGTYRWRDRTCRRCGAVNREAGPEPTIRGAGMTGPAGRRQSTDEEVEVNVVSQLQGWFFGGQPDGQGRSRTWRPMHDDPKDRNVVWYDTGEVGFRLVLDPSLDATYREAVLSTEVQILRDRIRETENASS